jgi:hypothetical protein
LDYKRHTLTHTKALPEIEGSSDFQSKCDRLRYSLFPDNPISTLTIPDDFVVSKKDLIIPDQQSYSEIQPSEQIKLLGATLDNTLTFVTHAQNAAPRSLQILGSLSFLRKRGQGISPAISRYLIITKVMPRMLWASSTWWAGAHTILHPLELAYHLMARWSTGLPPTTRSSKVLRCAHLPPLTAWLDWISTKYAINIITLSADHGLRPLPAYDISLSKLPGLRRILSFVNLFLSDRLETRSNLSLPIVEPLQLHMKKPQNPDGISDTNRAHESWIHKLKAGMIVVYTDGSRDDKGCTGAGWILYQKQQTSLNTIVNGSCNLGLRSEVFDAEPHAVYESLTYLISSSLKPNQI